MDIQLRTTKKEDYGTFKKDVKDVFSVAVVKGSEDSGDGEVIPDADIDGSLYAAHADVYDIYVDGSKVGGIVLEIDRENGYNVLDLFYIYPDFHSRGIGTSVWRLVEKMYPETRVWELVTPYFEKRNIHFYVNKCGFHIVEYFCPYHKDPGTGCDEEDFFRFEKVMKAQKGAGYVH